MATLEGHESYVKGVAWDPVGKYLASQSDDRSVHVWRMEVRACAPFAQPCAWGACWQGWTPRMHISHACCGRPDLQVLVLSRLVPFSITPPSK